MALGDNQQAMQRIACNESAFRAGSRSTSGPAIGRKFLFDITLGNQAGNTPSRFVAKTARFGLQRGVSRDANQMANYFTGFLSRNTSATWQPRPVPPLPGACVHVSVSSPPAVASGGMSNSSGSNAL